MRFSSMTSRIDAADDQQGRARSRAAARRRPDRGGRRARRPPAPARGAAAATSAAAGAGARAEIPDRQMRRLRRGALQSAAKRQARGEQRDVEHVGAVAFLLRGQRSSSNVARPASRSAAATRLLRGLNRPLPLPCAKMTSPSASAGTPSSACRRSSPSAISIFRDDDRGRPPFSCAVPKTRARRPGSAAGKTRGAANAGTPSGRQGPPASPLDDRGVRRGQIAAVSSLESPSMPINAMAVIAGSPISAGAIVSRAPTHTPAAKTLIAALLCLFVLGIRRRRPRKAPRAKPTATQVTGGRQNRQPTHRRTELPARVETRHSVQTEAGTLDYRAIAETIGLTDSERRAERVDLYGLLHRRTRRRAARSASACPPRRNRPVAFVFNGGPGAAAVFLHLGALGPRILETPHDRRGAERRRSARRQSETWLAFTDLVFVDPVGTGFSRGKGKEDNPDKPFWEVRERPEFARRGGAALADPARPLDLAGVLWSARAMAGCAPRRWRRAWRAMSGSRSAGSCWSRRRSTSPCCTPISATCWRRPCELPSYRRDGRGAVRPRPRRRACRGGRAFRAVRLPRRVSPRLTGIPAAGDPFIDARRRADRPARGDRAARARPGRPRTTFARELRRPERRDPQHL